MPSTAPRPARITLSVSIWRIRRIRVAPSDDRTASSRARSVARANCMFITFTHAMSSTPTQNASIVQSVPRSRRSRERVDAAAGPGRRRSVLFVSGYAAAKRLAKPVNSASADSSVTPRFRRPMTAGLLACGSLRGRTGNSL